MAKGITKTNHEPQQRVHMISAFAKHCSHRALCNHGRSLPKRCPRTHRCASNSAIIRTFRELTAILCVVLLAPANAVAVQTQQPAPSTQQPAASTQQPAAKITPDPLDSLVAPIALYPDPMLAQTLAASTYPLEIVQLQQWLAKNAGLKDKALADAVAKQPWDPRVPAIAAMPDLVKRLADDIQWTTDLGNAFLAQQKDVMDAVQRMRKKAQDQGNLKTPEQQKRET